MMKNKTNLVGTAVFIVLAGLVLHSCMQAPKDISKVIGEANQGFAAAYNTGDAKAIADLYTVDAKIFPSNSDPIEGQKAIEDFWTMALGMGINKVALETVKAEAVGDFAVEEGRYRLYVQGDQLVDQGKYLVNWKKVDGKWKLFRDIWNTSMPAPPQRAAVNDTVWVVLNHIKPDKVEQFEDFNFNILNPAAKEYFPTMMNTVRTLRPVDKNKDGSYTYIYLMDPAISPDGYDMMTPLTAKYGEEKAREYLNTFTDCLMNGRQRMWVTVQTRW